jgi:2-oxoisovalerate dehydrogenase E2 component (dihydrolipoyl transacylase)
MVKTMTASLKIPHMCYGDEVNMNNLLECRKTTIDGQKVKLSILPFAIKAASIALMDYPIINSSLNEEELTLTLHSNHNIGVAMDSPRGLAVPVLKACQTLSILEIAKELERLKEAVSRIGTDQS